MSRRIVIALLMVLFAAIGFGYDIVDELIWNGDFESVNTAHDSSGWVFYAAAGGDVSIVNTDSAGPGTQCLKLTSNSVAVNASCHQWPWGVPVEGGATLHFEFSYKTSSDISFVDGALAPFVQLTFWKKPDGGGTPDYPADYLDQEYIPLSDTLNAWEDISIDTVAPAGTEIARVTISIPEDRVDGGDILIDEVSLAGGLPFDAEFNWCKNGDAEHPEQFIFWNSTKDYEVMVRNDGAEGTLSSFGLDHDGVTTVSSRLEQFRNNKSENQRIPIEDPNGVIYFDFWYKTEAGGNFGANLLAQLLFYNAPDPLSANDNVYLGGLTYTLVETNGTWQNVTHIMDMSQLGPLGIIADPTQITHLVTKFINNAGNDGLVQFDQIRVLKKLPSADVPDVQQMGMDWLSNGVLPMEPDFVVDTFEDPNALVANEWYNKSTSVNNIMPTLTLVNDPGNGHGGSDQYMQWDYSLTLGNFQEFSRMFTASELGGADGIDLSIYDELRYWMFRDAGNSREGKIFNKFYTNAWGFDGDFSVIALTASAVQSDGSGTTQTPAAVWDEWVNDLRTLKSVGTTGQNKMYESLPLISNCSGIMFGVSSNDRFGGDLSSGTILVDDVRFVQTVPRCDGTTSTMDADGDCDVDMADVAIKGLGWLLTNE